MADSKGILIAGAAVGGFALLYFLTKSKQGSALAPPAKLALVTVSLPAGQVGQGYGAQLQATGGKAPYSWAVNGLPPGVVSASGRITGTPTTAGTAQVKVAVTDAAGTSVSAVFGVVITAAGAVAAKPKVSNFRIVAQVSSQAASKPANPKVGNFRVLGDVLSSPVSVMKPQVSNFRTVGDVVSTPAPVYSGPPAVQNFRVEAVGIVG